MHEPLTSEQAAAIIEFAQADLTDVVAFLQGLIRMPTVNPPGEAYPACARYMGEHLSTLGYSVEYIDLTPAEVAELAPYGDSQPRSNVIGRLAGAQTGPVLHFNGHIDVVPPGEGWTVAPFGGDVRSGRIYGRGDSDMKDGLDAPAYAIADIRQARLQLQG